MTHPKQGSAVEGKDHASTEAPPIPTYNMRWSLPGGRCLEVRHDIQIKEYTGRWFRKWRLIQSYSRTQEGWQTAYARLENDVPGSAARMWANHVANRKSVDFVTRLANMPKLARLESCLLISQRGVDDLAGLLSSRFTLSFTHQELLITQYAPKFYANIPYTDLSLATDAQVRTPAVGLAVGPKSGAKDHTGAALRALVAADILSHVANTTYARLSVATNEANAVFLTKSTAEQLRATLSPVVAALRADSRQALEVVEASDDIAAQLARAANLYEKGYLTREEFEAAKQTILSRH